MPTLLGRPLGQGDEALEGPTFVFAAGTGCEKQMRQAPRQDLPRGLSQKRWQNDTASGFQWPVGPAVAGKRQQLQQLVQQARWFFSRPPDVGQPPPAR